MMCACAGGQVYGGGGGHEAHGLRNHHFANIFLSVGVVSSRKKTCSFCPREVLTA